MSENKQKEYVAQFTTSIQINQYEYETIHPSMKVLPDTKMSDIVEFFNNNEPNSERVFLDIRISELQ